jgi:transcriptional regulator with XRE-family HTH domain
MRGALLHDGYSHHSHFSACLFVCQALTAPLYCAGAMPLLFGAKLRFLRKKLRVTQGELALQLGLQSHSYLSHLEAARLPPSLGIVLRCARALQVTTDYLLRDSLTVEQIQAATALPDDSAQLFGAKLRSLREQRGLTQQTLADSLHIASQGYISKLEAGQKEPSPDVVVQVADFFQVRVDYLLIDALGIGDTSERGMLS